MTLRSPLALLCCLIGVLRGPAAGGQQAEPAEAGRTRIVFCSTNNPALVWWIMDPDGTNREVLDPSTIARACPPVPRSPRCPLSPVVKDVRIDAGSIVLFDRPEWSHNVSDVKNRRTLAIKETGCFMPALSPQGDKVAFFAAGAGGRCLCISDTSEAPEVKARIPMAGALELSWSPDGEWITVCGEGAANANRFTGAPSVTGMSFIKADGTARHVIPDLGYRSGVWSPDGRRLAYVTSPPLCFQPVDLVLPVDPEPRKREPFAAEVFIVRPDGGEKTSIHKGEAQPLAWSPDGEWIVCQRAVDHDPQPWATLTLLKSDGSAERDIAPAGDPGHFGVVSWSPDGNRIAFWMHGTGLEESRVYVVRTDAPGETIPLRTGGTAIDGLAWSPDGRFIVTAAGPRIAGNAPPGDKDVIDSRFNLYLIPMDGSEPLQLTSDGTPQNPNVCPFWVVAKK